MDPTFTKNMICTYPSAQGSTAPRHVIKATLAKCTHGTLGHTISWRQKVFVSTRDDDRIPSALRIHTHHGTNRQGQRETLEAEAYHLLRLARAADAAMRTAGDLLTLNLLLDGRLPRLGRLRREIRCLWARGRQDEFARPKDDGVTQARAGQ